MAIEPHPDNLPEWASVELSLRLPHLRNKGEGQHLEFIEAFPAQARELAKEIAAFATAGGGIILIGIDDSGQLVGVDLQDVVQRDGYNNRVQGITHGAIKPSITPKLEFACEDNLSVVVITIHKGQPVYYYQNIPYIRHLTASRPATPDEVIQQILKWHGMDLSGNGIQVDIGSEYYWRHQLDGILVDVLIAIDEIPRLSCSPGPDYLRTTFEMSASGIRELVFKHLKDEDVAANSLKDLANKCDEIIATLTFASYGTWDTLEKGKGPQVKQIVEELRMSILGGPPVDDSFLEDAKQNIKTAILKLRELLERADYMINNLRQDDLILDVSEIGREILRITYYSLSFLEDKDAIEIQNAARNLHLLQYHEQSYRSTGSHIRLVRRITDQTKVIERIAAKID